MTNRTTPPPIKQKRAYENTSDVAKRNRDARTALTFIADNPEISEWIRDDVLNDLQDAIAAELTAMCRPLANQLAEAYGINLCPDLLNVYLADQFESLVRELSSANAEFAYKRGASKSNIARATGVGPTNCGKRFPNLASMKKPSQKTPAQENKNV